MTKNKPQKNILEGWRQIKFGDCFENKGGTSLEKFVVADGTHKFISIGNYFIGGYYFDNHQRVKINKKTSEKILQKGDLVMVLNDKTLAGELLGTSILIDKDDSYVYNQRSERLIPNKNMDSKFAWFFLNSNFRRKIVDLSQGGTQIYVNFSSIRKIQLLIPPLPEQKRIVVVLELWDKMIERLEKKIVLKKNIKKGLIQQLLTGKKRLPGFCGECEESNFCKFVEILKNGIPSFAGHKKYYSTSAILNEDKTSLVRYKSRPNRANMYPNVNDVGLAKMRGTNRCFIVDEKLSGSIFSTGFIFLRAKKGSDHSFIYYLISGSRFQYLKDLYSTSGIMGGISNKNLLSIKVKMPQLKEQKAIADVLTTADKEIDVLEKKLAKIKEQKKFLLNNLVTGQIRVPENI